MIKNSIITIGVMCGTFYAIGKIEDISLKRKIKDEGEIRDMEREWFNAGYDSGFEHGKRQAEFDMQFGRKNGNNVED